MNEQALLARAVDLAATNAVDGQLPFGALVVAGGSVIGRGVNLTITSGDITRHAEVEAVRAACDATGQTSLTGAVVFTSCEPCAMCQAVSALAGVERMVFACSSERAAALGFPASATMARMQRAWAAAAPGFVTQGLVPDPDLPFRDWNAIHRSSS